MCKKLALHQKIDFLSHLLKYKIKYLDLAHKSQIDIALNALNLKKNIASDLIFPAKHSNFIKSESTKNPNLGLDPWILWSISRGAPKTIDSNFLTKLSGNYPPLPLVP